jgi:PIN domain nuclease of toxin-antitoxin system
VLIAQALVENFVLITGDEAFARYDVPLILA